MTLAADLHRQQARQRRNRLGTGFTLAAMALAGFNLVVFLLHLDAYPRIPFSLAAWLLIVIAMILVHWFHLRSGRLPTAEVWLVLGVLAAAIVLDIAGARHVGTLPAYPSVVISTGAVLLQLSASVDHRVTVGAASVVAAIIVGGFLLHLPGKATEVAICYLIVGLAAAPPVLAVQVMRALDAVAGHELDRAQAHSAVGVDGAAAGLLASEELAQLDLEAERLLDQVATGRTELPLDAATAERAAAIATELRLHLLQGRTRTWLDHAVTESDFLSAAVQVIDSEGLAGSLTTRQRDGLLSAVWLLLSSGSGKGAPSVRVLISPPARYADGTPIEPVTIPISILATGVPRKGVDPATWHAVGRVGRYDESMASSGLLIEIGCPVDDEATGIPHPGT